MISYKLKAKPNKQQKKQILCTIKDALHYQNELIDLSLNMTCGGGAIPKHLDLMRFDSALGEYRNIPSDIKSAICSKVANSFSRWIEGDKDGKKSGRPRFKSTRKVKGSFSYTIRERDQHYIEQKNKNIIYVHIPFIGKIKCRGTKQEIKGVFQRINVKVDSCGDIWISLVTDANLSQVKIDSLCEYGGCDLGLKHKATCAGYDASNNPVILQPSRERFLDNTLLSLQHLSRIRDYKGQAHFYRRIARRRKDDNHKLAWQILKTYKTIYIGDLNPVWLMSGKLARSALDAGIGQLKELLQNKAFNILIAVKLE